MKPPQSSHPLDADRRVVRLPDAGHDGRLLLGAAEHDAYRAELARLRDVRDRELPARLREARSYVAADAQEEIAQLQEEQTVMHARIARLEDLLSGATVVPDGEASDLVTVGSTVEVEYRRTGRRITYRISGATDGEPGTVSARSPVGAALMGARVGDVVAAHLPGDRIEQIEIVGLTVALPQAS